MKRTNAAQLALFLMSAGTSPALLAADVSLASTSWTTTGQSGSIGGTSTVPVSPTGNTQLGYVTTAGGVTGVSPLVLKDEGEGSQNQTNGSRVLSGSFSAGAGDTLTLYFNYVSTDGRGYDDYAWARLVSATTQDTAAWLFTARSTNSANGNVVPGNALKRQVDNSLPDELDAVLNDGNTINFGVAGTTWAPLEFSSGICWDSANTCGPTGWIKSAYSFASAGTYQLEFGVINWGDEAYDSGLAFDFAGLSGARFGGDSGPLAPVPEPEIYAMLLAGLGVLARARRRLTRS